MKNKIFKISILGLLTAVTIINVKGYSNSVETGNATTAKVNSNSTASVIDKKFTPTLLLIAAAVTPTTPTLGGTKIATNKRTAMIENMEMSKLN